VILLVRHKRLLGRRLHKFLSNNFAQASVRKAPTRQLLSHERVQNARWANLIS
jgi:hypothetical protein